MKKRVVVSTFLLVLLVVIVSSIYYYNNGSTISKIISQKSDPKMGYVFAESATHLSLEHMFAASDAVITGTVQANQEGQTDVMKLPIETKNDQIEIKTTLTKIKVDELLYGDVSDKEITLTRPGRLEIQGRSLLKKGMKVLLFLKKTAENSTGYIASGDNEGVFIIESTFLNGDKVVSLSRNKVLSKYDNMAFLTLKSDMKKAIDFIDQVKPKYKDLSGSEFKAALFKEANEKYKEKQKEVSGGGCYSGGIVGGYTY